MKAVEFITKLKNNTILIPENIREELKTSEEKSIKVIVLISEAYDQENTEYRNMVREQFLCGYDDTDSVYDNT